MKPLPMINLDDLQDQLKEVENIRSIAFQSVLREHGIHLERDVVKKIVEDSYNRFMAMSSDEDNTGVVH